MAVRIPFSLNSAPGEHPHDSAGRLINAYAEDQLGGAPSEIAIKRSPGLKHLLSLPDEAHTRGLLDVENTLIWALNDKVYSVNSSFAATEMGALTGDDPITMAANHASPVNVVAVTETGCFTIDTPPISFADSDLPASPTSVCEYHGYFVWSYGSGQLWASDLNSVDVNALSFTTEQGLFGRRVVSYNDRLYLFGDKWTAVYRDAGTTPFPLAREATITQGIIGTHAVAGYETGWANELIWAGNSNSVYRLNGYTAVPISTDDVSRDIAAAVRDGLRNRIEAYVYTHGRNAFWVLSCHDRWTWEYNLTTNRWNERKTHDRNSWTGMKSVYIFDRWVIGDEDSGELHHISSSYFMDDILPLVWRVDSGIVHEFPRRVLIPRVSFFMSAGVGDYVVSYEPRVMISWSLDGGYSWGQTMLRRLGNQGEGMVYPSIVNCGVSKGQGVRFRLEVSDPVHVSLYGGVIDPQFRAI